MFPTVANLGMRSPAMLAKAAASLDQLSGGRFELGLGTGGFREAMVAMGGEARSPGENVQALTEAIEIIRAMWSGAAAAQYAGTYYRLSGVHPGCAGYLGHPFVKWMVLVLHSSCVWQLSFFTDKGGQVHGAYLHVFSESHPLPQRRWQRESSFQALQKQHDGTQDDPPTGGAEGGFGACP